VDSSRRHINFDQIEKVALVDKADPKNKK